MQHFTVLCPRSFLYLPLSLLERLLVRLVLRLLVTLLPARGRHRAEPGSTRHLSPRPRHTLPPARVPLPRHKSPYAQDAVAERPFVDPPHLVRPYVLSPPSGTPDSPELQAQAERRWVLDMALRGIDVGPATIHGVRLRSESRTVRVTKAA